MFIPRNTQFGMLANMAALIAPLRALMKSRVVSGRVIGVDDTSVAAARAMAMYRGLYDVEDRVREASADERLELRQRESVPLMNEFHNWLIAQRSDPRVLPKSSPGKAVRYALNQWDELSVFPGDGAIPFDNNLTTTKRKASFAASRSAGIMLTSGLCGVVLLWLDDRSGMRLWLQNSRACEVRIM